MPLQGYPYAVLRELPPLPGRDSVRDHSMGSPARSFSGDLPVEISRRSMNLTPAGLKVTVMPALTNGCGTAPPG